MIGLLYCEVITTMLSRFHRVQKRSERTDGRTDRIAISISRVNMWRAIKNVTLFTSLWFLQTLTNFYNIWHTTYRVNLQHNNPRYCCCTTLGKDDLILVSSSKTYATCSGVRVRRSSKQHETLSVYSSGLRASNSPAGLCGWNRKPFWTIAMKFWI